MSSPKIKNSYPIDIETGLDNPKEEYLLVCEQCDNYFSQQNNFYNRICNKCSDKNKKNNSYNCTLQ